MSEWKQEGEEIRRTVTAPDFPTAIRIVDEIAVKAEELNHHPDIDIRWRTLHLTLTTHDAGGLTDLDHQLAAIIDDIARKHGA
ncbi:MULTISPECIES: 4a-hydroxytetrahydrobiopterin dehydratase [Nonomuraea]|jgi:4a-hydroxytetrahydrobiopterin dehydratase|uniref:Putative pterin-4-alpha-carbinolamine dehydratase n=3 Tax=Nonomuraea TaxID=83681 RepID=A0A7W5YE25_9ACTN|nr:4a-hydroxytetrahydrobiopterin dehydratase [Nonomuraea dietziae]MBB3731168.1 4a-hydroxytetrahydrobiopterin dehydratase [Nonomuraea dietziae]